MSKITIPYIEGDGVGKDITPIMIDVVNLATNNKIEWIKLDAGEKAFEKFGSFLPEHTLDLINQHNIAIKGPMTTPVGGGIRSLNVFLRKHFDLFACVRPVRYFDGVDSPMKDPTKMNIVVFRENTEDIYSGIEWESGTKENETFADFIIDELDIQSIRFPRTSSYGVKVVSKEGSERLIRSAFEYANSNNLKKVTLVHKGNIMKFTEGMFKTIGYEVAKDFPNIEVNDFICDNFLQQMILDPSQFEVIATLNLNGDYISDAAAAEVGGIGISPGANINYQTKTAIFEATHGTAPDIAGKNIANPTSLLLSACMMLQHLGLDKEADKIENAIIKAYKNQIFTKDLDKENFVSTFDFGQYIIDNL